MDKETKKIITDYLKGPRNYREGVALYDRYGSNLRLKQQFNLSNDAQARDMLFNELRLLAGLSEAEFAGLPRLAKTKAKSETTTEPRETTTEPGDSGIPASETVQKMIRFRERFPFLNDPDCPDVLKILVADMFTCYGQYKDAHRRLAEYPDEVLLEAAEDCRKVVESYLENQEIWEELEHYKKTGTILGKAAKARQAKAAEELATLSDLDLMARYKSAQVQTSKRRAALSAAEQKEDADAVVKARAAFDEWSQKKDLLQAEVDRRKKK